MKVIIYAIVVLLFIGFAIGMWQLARTWNYNLSYRGMVKETVREMVKESALK